MSERTTSMDTIITLHFLQLCGVVCACAVRHGRRAIRVEGVADEDVGTVAEIDAARYDRHD